MQNTKKRWMATACLLAVLLLGGLVASGIMHSGPAPELWVDGRCYTPEFVVETAGSDERAFEGLIEQGNVVDVRLGQYIALEGKMLEENKDYFLTDDILSQDGSRKYDMPTRFELPGEQGRLVYQLPLHMAGYLSSKLEDYWPNKQLRGITVELGAKRYAFVVRTDAP